MEMNWASIAVIIAIAIIIETLTENVKNYFPKLAETKWAVMLFTALLGIVVALTYDADIFAAVGLVAKIPYMGTVLTGVLVAGGSNVIFDIVKRIQASKTETANIITDIEEVTDTDERG